MKIPRKAPTLTTKTERERVMERMPKWSVTPTAAWCNHFSLDDAPSAPLVYAVMAAHANRYTRNVRIGQQRIATAVHIHSKTVARSQRLLERRGLIKRLGRMPPPASVQIWRIVDVLDTPKIKPHKRALNGRPRTRPAP